MVVAENLFVITGGPGSGKSTLIRALAAEGYGTLSETGRAIIREQESIGGAGLPWADRRLYAELMLSRQIERFTAAQAAGGPVFCDRGIPDVLGYVRLVGLPEVDHFQTAATHFRYAPTIFVAPFWPDIFVNDAERKQDLAEAEATWRIMVRTYGELGYILTELPRASVAERVAFVVASIGGEKER